MALSRKRSSGQKRLEGNQYRFRFAMVRFSGNGTMITGWFGTEAGDWYYLNPDDGAMLAAHWFKVNGKWYYATKSGQTAKNTYVKSTAPDLYCWVGADGSWEPKRDTKTPDLMKYELAE